MASLMPERLSETEFEYYFNYHEIGGFFCHFMLSVKNKLLGFKVVGLKSCDYHHNDKLADHLSVGANPIQGASIAISALSAFIICGIPFR